MAMVHTSSKTIFAAIILMMSFAAPVMAGPSEDVMLRIANGDYAAAIRRWRPLADQGDAFAQFYLGVLYKGGWGVPQDYQEAAKLFRLAADQGNANAQNDLADMYARGEGMPQDLIRAHMWYNLSNAVQRSNDVRGDRDMVAKRMTPAQIAEAQKPAREWKPNK